VGQDRFTWLISKFADDTEGVAHAVVVSADGVRIASSAGLPTDRAEQLGSITAGLLSICTGAARLLEFGPHTRTLVELDRGLMLLMMIRERACLVVLAEPTANLEIVAFEMSRLVDQAGALLSPLLRIRPGPDPGSP
jgi:predicted regulator of Ras-like GTPase activity (Roadblock/LC7/MglB family)